MSSREDFGGGPPRQDSWPLGSVRCRRLRTRGVYAYGNSQAQCQAKAKPYLESGHRVVWKTPCRAVDPPTDWRGVFIYNHKPGSPV